MKLLNLRIPSARGCLGLLFCALFVAACHGPNWFGRSPRADLVVDGNDRLGKSVVPLHYELDLRIDPAAAQFSGRVAIELRVETRSASIELHARGLHIREVDVRADGERHAARVALGPNGGLAIAVDPPLEAGFARIEIRYDAPLPETPFGLYRVAQDGAWYAFTQFEPLDARRAFPCFDQPEFKTPFDVTLRVPAGLLAVSNAPEASRDQDAATSVFRFAQTRPLPTYLVAFAVGDFDVVELAGSADPPIRVLTTHGRGDLAHYALEWTPRVLDWLSEYFDGPYPFAKLDLIAVPNFRAGAMENAGLVTFRERLLLVDPEAAPLRHRIASLIVITHELAHMWFGDLVTMRWWDDLWLNESFASWMSTKAVGDLAPEFELELQAVAHTQYVMYLDSRQDAQPIRREIRHGGDVYNAFDGITYGKGEAVLRMLESWIGADAFRDAVRQYVVANAYGTAATEDLLSAMSSASQRDVGELLGTFLDRPGTPLLEVEIDCEDGRGAEVELRQSRHSVDSTPRVLERAWQIPTCLVWGRHDAPGLRIRDCFVMEEERSRHTLVGKVCPAWLHPNANEVGYYRWQVSEGDLLAMLGDHAHSLSAAEQVAIPGLASAQLEAGTLSLAGYFDALSALASARHWRVLEGVAHRLDGMERTAREAGSSESYAAFVRELLQPRLDALGKQARARDSVGDRMLRGPLLTVLADAGMDSSIRLEAAQAAKRFTADPFSLPGDLASAWLPIAAWSGDEALWQSLVSMLSDDLAPWQRTIVVQALASFEDAALLERSFDLVLDGALRAQDYGPLVGGVRPVAQLAAWNWLEKHYTELVSVLGEASAASLPSMGRGFCKVEDARRVEAFFSQPEHAPEGTEQNLREVIEDIDRCARLQNAALEPLRRYLAERD